MGFVLTRSQEVTGSVLLVLHATRSGLFACLCVVGAVFLTLHTIAINLNHRVARRAADMVRIDMDNTIPEKFEYSMLLVTALLLLKAARAAKGHGLALTAIVALYLMLDNAVGIHELAGAFLYPAHARAGEVMYAAIVITAVVVPGAIIFRRSTLAERQALMAIAIVLAMFAFFSVVVDAFHSVVVRLYDRFDLLIGTIEDSGEFLSIALLLTLASRLDPFLSRRSAPVPVSAA